MLDNLKMDELITATNETLYMTFVSLIGTIIIGVALGLLLFLTTKDGIWENKVINVITGGIVNIFRSIPFIILIILLFPFTNLLIGTLRGPTAALPALIISTAPFYARLVEIAFKEVDKGVIEAA